MRSHVCALELSRLACRAQCCGSTCFRRFPVFLLSVFCMLASTAVVPVCVVCGRLHACWVSGCRATDLRIHVIAMREEKHEHRSWHRWSLKLILILANSTQSPPLVSAAHPEMVNHRARTNHMFAGNFPQFKFPTPFPLVQHAGLMWCPRRCFLAMRSSHDGRKGEGKSTSST